MSVRKNLFYGGVYAELSLLTYEMLIKRLPVTYLNVMEKYYENSPKYLGLQVSYYPYYGELKKAFPAVLKFIKIRAGEDSIKVLGDNRTRSYQYVGKDDDPLADMRNAKVIQDLKQYWRFCQDSAGFFPKSWLDYFFRDCQDLLDIRSKRQRGEQVINTSVDREHRNIEYLPMLYEAIKNKMVLEIDYKPYDKDIITLTFHPHFLNEYNGRWTLLGHADGYEPVNGYSIPLDRFENRPREREKNAYIPAPPMFYDNFFKDIVGVSHTKDRTVYDVVIRAHTHTMFKLTQTKPIHHSQETITPFGEYETGIYGEFKVSVEINNEFIGRILQMGDALEVVSPAEVRETFRLKVTSLHNRYISG